MLGIRALDVPGLTSTEIAGLAVVPLHLDEAVRIDIGNDSPS
jgi:hypothetical protein